MKIVIFTSAFPFPLDEGGKMAQFGFIEYLVKEHEVLLVAEDYIGLSKNVEALSKLLPSLNIKILHKIPLENTKGAGAFLLKIIEKIQWRLNKRFGKKSKFSKVTDNNAFIYPIKSRKAEITDQFVTILQNENPDLVQIDFIDNADMAILIPVHIPKVLVHHDLRFVSVKQACLLEGYSRGYTNYLSQFVKTIEASFLNYFDTIITFSEDDRQKLLPIMFKHSVISTPFPVLDKNMMQLDNKPYSIEKLIFIGPAQHAPNYDAIDWYAKEMVSLIWEKLKLKLLVIGKWSEADISAFLKIEGIEFAGYVEDIKKVSQNSLMIVPLRIGSGIRTKLLDAFAYGIPVITTTIGCEGIGAHHEQEIIIADNYKEFIKSIETLNNDPELVKLLRHNANSFVKKNYSQQEIFNRRMDIYEKIISKSHYN